MENDGSGTNDLSLGAKNDIFVEFQRMVSCVAAKMPVHEQSRGWRCTTAGLHTNSHRQEHFSSPEKRALLTPSCGPTYNPGQEDGRPIVFTMKP